MDRFNANRVIAAGYALTAVTVYFDRPERGERRRAGAGRCSSPARMMNTAQSSLPALAAVFYPTQGRATGVAWMLGIGRFGGIAGSFLVARAESPPARFRRDLHGGGRARAGCLGSGPRQAIHPS